MPFLASDFIRIALLLAFRPFACSWSAPGTKVPTPTWALGARRLTPRVPWGQGEHVRLLARCAQRASWVRRRSVAYSLRRNDGSEPLGAPELPEVDFDVLRLETAWDRRFVRKMTPGLFPIWRSAASALA